MVIRAAYLALMRRYHPDKDGSPAASQRAQAIIAAFAVLGDPERRLRYDWDRRRAAEDLARPPPRRLEPRHALGAVALMSLLIASLALMSSPPTGRAPPLADTGTTQPAPPPPASVTPTIEADEPARPVTSPPVTPPEREQPAKLAETAKTAEARSDPLLPRAASQPPRSLAAPAKRTRAAVPASTAGPMSGATQECDPARPNANSAACKNDNLAALDRLALAFYGQSLRVGDTTKRAALQVSRTGLLTRLQACRSEPCLRDAYLTHMREISAIVESKPSP